MSCADCGSEDELHDYVELDLTTIKVCIGCYHRRNGEVYGPCEDCGIHNVLEKFSTDGLPDMMLCDPCTQTRMRQEPDDPGFPMTREL